MFGYFACTQYNKNAHHCGRVQIYERGNPYILALLYLWIAANLHAFASQTFAITGKINTFLRKNR